MKHLLIPFYCLLLALVIYRWQFFNAKGISRTFIAGIFLAKCLLGLLYTYVHIHIIEGGDILYFFNDSQVVYQSLFDSPKKFLFLTFAPNATVRPDFVAQEISSMGYWWTVSSYVLVRFNALCSLFSLGNLYTHSIFMAFLSMVGLTALYKSLLQMNFNLNKLLVIGIFLIPSVLFWTSGVHKEGLLMCFLGLLFYQFTTIYNKSLSFSSVFWLLISAFFILLVRDFVLFLLFPGLLALLVARHYSKHAWLTFTVIYAACMLAGMLVPVLNGGTYLDMIALRQQEFLLLDSGNTNIAISSFKPTLTSLFIHIPEALYNTLLSPFSLSFDTTFHVLAFLENVLLTGLILTCIMLCNWKNLVHNHFGLWMICYSMSMLLLIGYIVPNIGAIIRYRSIALPFLLIGLVLLIRNKFEKQLKLT